MNIGIMGSPKPNPRDADQLIYDLAEHGNRPADVSELYRRLPNLEFFAKVLSANFPLQNGARHTTAPGESLETQIALLPGGHRLAQFFIDRADPRLGPQFISISPREACQMVLKMAGLAGLLICNSKNSWTALLNPELRRLLEQELAETLVSPSGGPATRSGDPKGAEDNRRAGADAAPEVLSLL